MKTCLPSLPVPPDYILSSSRKALFFIIIASRRMKNKTLLQCFRIRFFRVIYYGSAWSEPPLPRPARTVTVKFQCPR
ncbi:hypothetical protein HMPREF1548_05875 [Clostridium sp. KLE 1755]|nr:hypothetical protein HMPREF1548_05875 [Clostridium sp. KLE 1755]